MKTKFFSMLIALIVFSNAYSQSNLNDYKYIIVPNKFDFLKNEDQYQLNSLAAFLFKKYGFTALKEGGTYPADFSTNRCLALRSDVTKDPGMFKTKLKVVLKDCNDQIVYTSQIGNSREKEFSKAYHEAIRNAFKSFETVEYAYAPNENNPIVSTQPSANNNQSNEVVKEIQKLKEELETLKKEKETKVVETLPAITEKPEVKKVAVVNEPKQIETVETKKPSSNVLYAQEIANGYQLVDSTPKVVYRIIKTGASNVFLVENLSAIVYKKGDGWLLEHYTGNAIIKETLNIKF